MEARADCIHAIKKAGGDSHLEARVQEMETKMMELTKNTARKWNLSSLVVDHSQIKDRADQKKGVFVSKSKHGNIDDNFNLDDFGAGQPKVEMGGKGGGANNTNMTLGLDGTLGLGGIAPMGGGDMSAFDDSACAELVTEFNKPKNMHQQVHDVGNQIEEVQKMALAAGSHGGQTMASGKDQYKNAMDHVERDAHAHERQSSTNI